MVWVIDGKHTNSMMGVLVLKPTGVPGSYSADGTVMLREVSAISVTADLSAKQHMPTMPVVAVLSSEMWQVYAPWLYARSLGRSRARIASATAPRSAPTISGRGTSGSST